MPSTVTVVCTEKLGRGRVQGVTAWLSSDSVGQEVVQSRSTFENSVTFTAIDDGTYYLWVASRSCDYTPIAGQTVTVAGSNQTINIALRSYPYNAMLGASLATIGANVFGEGATIRDHVSFAYIIGFMVAGPMDGDVYTPAIWKEINASCVRSTHIYTNTQTGRAVVSSGPPLILKDVV